MSSSMPVPRPVTDGTGPPGEHRRSAPPTPWCCRSPCRPSTSRSCPSVGQLAATSAPTSSAACGLPDRHRGAGGEVRAFPAAPSGGRPRRDPTRSAATPTSTTRTVAPTWSGDRVDGRAAGQEVAHHLRRDLLRPRRDARRHHAVVRREDGHRRARGTGGGQRARDRGQADTQLLEAPERPGGLVEPVVARPRRAQRRRVDGRDRCPARARTLRSSSGPPFQCGLEAGEAGGVGTAMRTPPGMPKERACRARGRRGAPRWSRSAGRVRTSTQLASDGSGSRPTRSQQRDQRVAQPRDRPSPTRRVGPGEQVGEDGGDERVDRPARLPGDEALGEDRVGRDDVADPQTGTGEELGERADHDRAGITPRPPPVASG